jgi:putative membrane protein
MLRSVLEWALHFVLSGAAVFIVAKIAPGVRVASFGAAVLFAVVQAILSTLAWGILAPLTVTFSVLTLGVGFFVVHGLVFSLAARVVSGVSVSGFFAAAIAAVLLSLVSSAIHFLFGR